MNVIDAVTQVLEEAGKPLSTPEITQRILARRLWIPEGRTPNDTIRGSIGTEIRKYGDNSRFQRVSKGKFGLRGWDITASVTDISEMADAPSKLEEVPEPENSTPTERAAEASINSSTLSFTDAAENVLEQFGNRKPMHYVEITRLALDHRLLSTRGQTPAQTMYAQILTEIERFRKRGEVARFVKEGRGLVGLTKWINRGLAHQIEHHNNEVRKALHGRLYGISSKEFEDLIGALLIKIGFADVQVTGRSGDGGIDVRGTLVVGGVIRTRMAVQAKRWKNNVQAPIVQQVRGSLGAHEQGLIITTSDFSGGAQREAERSDATPVALMNGEQLVELLIENDLGIRRNSYDLIELSEAPDDGS